MAASEGGETAHFVQWKAEKEVTTIRLGSRGLPVKEWQSKLGLAADGVFGPITEAETRAWQRSHGLVPDGVVGPRTWAKTDAVSSGPSWMPPLPEFRGATLAERNALFGEFAWSPTDGGNIRILGNWVQENIVQIEVPQLAGVEGANSRGSVTCHRLAADPIKKLFASWQRAGLKSRLLSYAGCWVPRFIRGGQSLSNHAHGTAFDINARWNWLGQEPAKYGEQGCLLEMVHIAQSQSWYWGGHFARQDAMHFELATLSAL